LDSAEAAATIAAKRALRSQIVAARDALPLPEQQAQSRLLSQRLIEHPKFIAAATVLAYASFASEVRTGELLAACLSCGKRLVLPRVNRALRRLELYVVTDLAADLAPGTWGILEPRPDRCTPVIDRAAIDVVLVPGAAFTPKCERMGYGGGFYDRLLEGWPGKGHFMALAYDAQIVDALPQVPTDVLMHEVITPTRRFERES